MRANLSSESLGMAHQMKDVVSDVLLDRRPDDLRRLDCFEAKVAPFGVEPLISVDHQIRINRPNICIERHPLLKSMQDGVYILAKECLSMAGRATGEAKRVTHDRPVYYRECDRFARALGHDIKWPILAHKFAALTDKIVNDPIAKQAMFIKDEHLATIILASRLIARHAFERLEGVFAAEEPLVGEEALDWDLRFMAEEQATVQPLYEAFSPEVGDAWNSIVGRHSWRGVAIAMSGVDLPVFPQVKDIRDLPARLDYAFDALGNAHGQVVTKARRERALDGVDPNFFNGERFMTLAQEMLVAFRDAGLT